MLLRDRGRRRSATLSFPLVMVLVETHELVTDEPVAVDRVPNQSPAIWTLDSLEEDRHVVIDDAVRVDLAQDDGVADRRTVFDACSIGRLGSCLVPGTPKAGREAQH